jgi:hypothetical protein
MFGRSAWVFARGARISSGVTGFVTLEGIMDFAHECEMFQAAQATVRMSGRPFHHAPTIANCVPKTEPGDNFDPGRQIRGEGRTIEAWILCGSVALC